MIAICPNPFRDTGLEISLKIKQLLESNGYSTVICPVFGDNSDEIIPEGIECHPLETIAQCELAVVVGGDGTILSACRRSWEYKVPIIGVNLGTMGFMAAVEPDELELLLKAARGEVSYSKRMLLDVCVKRGEEVIYKDIALNDAVIHGFGDCINLNAMVDGSNITAFSGDGIVISTPTGSTGYSLSAGGPIVEPEAENFIIAPICAHVYGSRAFVLSADRTITVETRKVHDRKAYVAVDGSKAVDIVNGDILEIRKSELYTVMVQISPKSFFDIAYEKLT